jgi:hypothetical protein
MGRNGWIDASSLALGMPLGIAVGFMMDNPAFGIPIGIAFGIAFAAGKRREREGEDGGARDDRGA